MKNNFYTVLITGANRGIGLEFAKQYAKEGWQVFACSRHPDKATDLQNLTKTYSNIKILPLDVTRQEDIENLSKTLNNQAIDILINNAGIYGDTEQSLGNISIETMQNVFLTNSIAPLKISEILIPNLQKGQLRTIASISSSSGSIEDNTEAGVYAYRASKAALNMLMKNLALDLKPKGIKVLSLHPGWVKTDMGGKGALIEAEDSVLRLREVIAGHHPVETGHFYSYKGERLNW